MNDLNYLAIVVAALAAFVISSVWYIVFDTRGPEAESPDSTADTDRPPTWKLLVELVRSLVVAIVVAGFANNLGIVDFTDAIQLGLAFWVGFPLVLLVGSVIWENVPRRAAAIHAGDWLVKTLTMRSSSAFGSERLPEGNDRMSLAELRADVIGGYEAPPV